MILDGRYFLPVFSSYDFWNRPFGIGMGNYGLAANFNEIKIGYFGIYPPVWIHTSMSNPYEMFPIPESDILLLSVSFGWASFFTIILLYVNTLYNSLCGKYSFEQIKGVLLLSLLIFSGFFQDFLDNQVVWIFYFIAISMILKKEKRYVENLNNI
jgi:hypothetical protein